MLDNLKFDSATNKLYSGGLSRAIEGRHFHGLTKDHHPGVYSFIIEIDVSKDEVQIQKNIAITDKMMILTNGLRMGNHVIAGSLYYDGILVCPANPVGKY